MSSDAQSVEIPSRARIIAKHSGQYLDVASGSEGNGARIVQWPRKDVDNQLFRIEAVPDADW
ncbi:RICIN domain-containing protein [Streptomyces sp. RK9]|uniref:RICIN domain-containing protein n=1 Tax=Streptomyces sp. RK9 TaxID=3239284 RepID=UPI00386CA2D9